MALESAGETVSLRRVPPSMTDVRSHLSRRPPKPRRSTCGRGATGRVEHASDADSSVENEIVRRSIDSSTTLHNAPFHTSTCGRDATGWNGLSALAGNAAVLRRFRHVVIVRSRVASEHATAHGQALDAVASDASSRFPLLVTSCPCERAELDRKQSQPGRTRPHRLTNAWP